MGAFFRACRSSLALALRSLRIWRAMLALRAVKPSRERISVRHVSQRPRAADDARCSAQRSLVLFAAMLGIDSVSHFDARSSGSHSDDSFFEESSVRGPLGRLCACPRRAEPPAAAGPYRARSPCVRGSALACDVDQPAPVAGGLHLGPKSDWLSKRGDARVHARRRRRRPGRPLTRTAEA
jgi:hypothetical protein